MISVIRADITTLEVDAIVNAANESLLGGGGVDGAIHQAAGPELKDWCRTLGGCPTGSAKLTPGFRLSARWVIHAVGPVWRGGDHHEVTLLADSYRNAFEVAREVKPRTIAFPAISTGVYGFPKYEAARTAISVMREYEDEFEQIVACCFSEADRALYEQLLINVA